eukprot:c17535_g1_i1 orf=537-2114(-)
MSIFRIRERGITSYPPVQQDKSYSEIKLRNGTGRFVSRFLHIVNMNYLTGYRYPLKRFILLLLVSAIIAAVLETAHLRPGACLQTCVNLFYNRSLLTISLFIACAITLYMMYSPRPVYLVDYACFLPSHRYRIPFASFIEHSNLGGHFNERSIEFQRKIMERSGVGERTAFPFAMHYLPPRPSMSWARAEAETVIYTMLDELFDKSGVRPKDIGILVENSSMFNPSPSISAMIVNKYKMRNNIRSFQLAGMGCAAGIIGLDLVKDLLQVHRNTYGLLVSTENITLNWYLGNYRPMLLPNCLFRLGGSAILLSNRRSDRLRSKYKLMHSLRTHKGTDDGAYRCVYQEEDEDGILGVSLSKDLMAVAGDALKTNITNLGPLVLPFSEQLLFAASLVARKLIDPKIRLYMPDFKLAFEHFCIHAGGRAVIDELEKTLRLEPKHVEASRMTLHRFGNVSSACVWYELAYSEAKGRVKTGDRVWQIGLGSGFKCASAVWRALRNISPAQKGPWNDCIHEYPVNIPEVRQI